jgi:hypothetical protein
MGKGDVNIPEAYELEELIDAQKELNRFDSHNPWGSQTWDDTKTVMTQSVNPELERAVDQNVAYANSNAPVYNSPWRLQNAGFDMISEVMGRAGMPASTAQLVQESNPRVRKMSQGGAPYPAPATPAPAAPADPAGQQPVDPAQSGGNPSAPYGGPAPGGSAPGPGGPAQTVGPAAPGQTGGAPPAQQAPLPNDPRLGPQGGGM